MLVETYTAHNLCHALGVGGFEPVLAQDEAVALRLLLTPSFHAEVCLTFIDGAHGIRLTAVAARSQVWRQPGIAPQPCEIDSDSGVVDRAVFDDLMAAWQRALAPHPPAAWVILDGMRVHAAATRADQVATFDAAVHEHPDFDRFVAAALNVAWACLAAPRVRNAIAHAAGYARCKLPQLALPPDKAVFRTMVLGSDDDTAAILESLKKQHPR